MHAISSDIEKILAKQALPASTMILSLRQVMSLDLQLHLLFSAYLVYHSDTKKPKKRGYRKFPLCKNLISTSKISIEIGIEKQNTQNNHFCNVKTDLIGTSETNVRVSDESKII